MGQDKQVAKAPCRLGPRFRRGSGTRLRTPARAALAALHLGWPALANAQDGAPAAIAVAPTPPPPPPPPPDPFRRPFEAPFDVLHAGGTSGVRVSQMMLDGSDDDSAGSGFGAQLAGESERFGARRLYSTRESGFGYIGGGAVGFEGGIGADMAWGVRIPVGQYHGPFFRAGLRGWMLGNDRLYSSLLEIPQLQFGYQLLARSTVLEVGWRVGPVLAGRFNTGHDASRKLGKSFEVGSYTVVHAAPVHFDLGLTRVLENDREGPLHLVEGKLCGNALVVRLCMDGRYFIGREKLNGQWARLGDSTQAFYGGLTVGLDHEAAGALEPSGR